MRAVLRQAVPEAEALEGTAEGLPLPDSCADAVTAASAFHWFRPVEALAEVARMLRPGGQLAVVYGKRDWESELQRREREEFLAQVQELGERQVSPLRVPVRDPDLGRGRRVGPLPGARHVPGTGLRRPDMSTAALALTEPTHAAGILTR